MADIQNLLRQLLQAVYGKDVRQSIHDAIKQCYYDGKAGAVDLVAREQIANLVANDESSEGNSELVDIRVGADGKTYASAGEAIRTQFSQTLLKNQGKSNANKYLKVNEMGEIDPAPIEEVNSMVGFDYDTENEFEVSLNLQNEQLLATLSYPIRCSIDDVAINDKSFKEIFVDGNIVKWGDFENNTSDLRVNAGTPTLTNEAYVSPRHSVKAFGSTSQQYVTTEGYALLKNHTRYIACKVRCDRYVKGTLGISGIGNIGASRVTKGFETFSATHTVGADNAKFFVGSFNSADLDGYIDDLVIVDLNEVFGDDIPSKEEMDSIYEDYISIVALGVKYYKKGIFISGENDSTVGKDYTSEQCISKFMELLNKKAQYYGMLKSSFTSPSGAGGNITCAKDLAISGYYACGYRDILDIWKNKTYEVDIKGLNARKTSIASTLMSTEIGGYTIYGGKTGSWSGTENLVAIAEIKGKIYVCCVMDCGSSSNRFTAMKELLDVIANESGEVNTASAACAYELGTQIPQLYDVTKITPVYSKQETSEIIPASVTKIMTAMTALDFCPDLGEKIEFISSDLEGGSGAIFQAGDIVSLKDAIAALLLPSSNMAATAIARNIGKLCLERVGN